MPVGGLKHTGSRNNLYSATVPAAGTVIGTVVKGLAGANALMVQGNFTYGSGGTTCKVYVQTSLDGGATWVDIACFAFTTSSARRLSAVNSYPSTAFTANTTPGDAALTDNTVLNGLIGDMVRAKVVIVGTYAATTLAVDIVAKG